MIRHINLYGTGYTDINPKEEKKTASIMTSLVVDFIYMVLLSLS